MNGGIPCLILVLCIIQFIHSIQGGVVVRSLLEIPEAQSLSVDQGRNSVHFIADYSVFKYTEFEVVETVQTASELCRLQNVNGKQALACMNSIDLYSGAELVCSFDISGQSVTALAARETKLYFATGCSIFALDTTVCPMTLSILHDTCSTMSQLVDFDVSVSGSWLAATDSNKLLIVNLNDDGTSLLKSVPSNDGIRSVSFDSTDSVYVCDSKQIFYAAADDSALELFVGNGEATQTVIDGSNTTTRFMNISMLDIDKMTDTVYVYDITSSSLIALNGYQECREVDPTKEWFSVAPNVTMTPHGDWMAITLEDNLFPVQRYEILFGNQPHTPEASKKGCSYSTNLPSRYFSTAVSAVHCKRYITALIPVSDFQTTCNSGLNYVTADSLTRTYQSVVTVRSTYGVELSPEIPVQTVEQVHYYPFSMTVQRSSLVMARDAEDVQVQIGILIEQSWLLKTLLQKAQYSAAEHEGYIDFVMIVPQDMHFDILSVNESTLNRAVSVTITDPGTSANYRIVTLTVPLNPDDCSFSGVYHMLVEVNSTVLNVPDPNSPVLFSFSLTTEDICAVSRVSTPVNASIVSLSGQRILLSRPFTLQFTLSNPDSLPYISSITTLALCETTVDEISCLNETTPMMGKVLLGHPTLATPYYSSEYMTTNKNELNVTVLVPNNIIHPNQVTAKFRVVALCEIDFLQPSPNPRIRSITTSSAPSQHSMLITSNELELLWSSDDQTDEPTSSGAAKFDSCLVPFLLMLCSLMWL